MSARLFAALHDALADRVPAGRLLVGYSGGLDSSVLLHALVAWNQGLDQPRKIHAVHVHHGLSPAADDWERHCRQTAHNLDTPLTIARVSAQSNGGPEAGARRARYAAFAELLKAGDLLLLAHQRRDQAETFLLRVLRGAGMRGLAAMPRERPLAAGRLLRPFLHLAPGELHAYAREVGIDWVEDESNQDLALDRNLLRIRVLPVLASRWPASQALLAQAADYAHEANGLLCELGGADLAYLQDGSHALNRRKFLHLSAARRRNALLVWLGRSGLDRPPAKTLREIDRQVAQAENFSFQLQQGSLRCHAGRILLLRGLPPQRNLEGTWNPAGGHLDLGYAQLHATPAVGAGLRREREVWHLGSRKGGERLLLGGQHRKLKEILRERSVPTWTRPLLPLIHAGDKLVAVGDLAISDDWRARAGESGWRLSWQAGSDYARCN